MLEKLRKNKLKIGILLILLALCVLFVVNKKHSQQVHNYITTLKMNMKKNEKKTLNLQFPKPATYQADSLREPFEGAQAIKGGTVLNPLLTYPINMLRFVGTLSKDNKLYAYVLAPNNKLYQVTVGKKIGDHNGTVSVILPNRLEVIEQDSDSGKPSTQRKVVLQLKDVNG